MSLPVVSIGTVVRRIWSFDGQDANEFCYAATVSIWVRWAFHLACLVESSYRVEYGSVSHVLNTLYVFGLMAANGYLWWKIRANGWVEPRWLLAISALDVACVTFSVSLSGGFDSRYFAVYYFAAALFAWLFTSPVLVLSWTTMVGAIYVALCVLVGDGIDLGEQEEKVLFYRLLGLYGVAVWVNLITRFERLRRARAVEREGELNRQRIEMSQTIHDTTAQSAYTLGLGLEGAIEQARPLGAELTRRLEAMSDLSKSTMWALRHPIDGGHIFSGGTLSEVLTAHVDTFTVITSIPSELVQVGDEPELSTITRSLLFSIAHNALTNAFRHSGAGSVTVFLDFEGSGLSISVVDDGVGLPEDYAVRGHGFRNMTADAERMGGVLEVESTEDGTTVICSVPYGRDKGGS